LPADQAVLAAPPRQLIVGDSQAACPGALFGMVAVIDTFRAEHAGAFAALNRAWLVQHGLLEQADEEQLADPWGHILTPGGQIFVVLRNGEVLGTCAVVPHEPGVVELAKLAVDPAAQGQGLGRRLIEACLRHARAQGARRVVLESSSRLGAALRLYEAFGFVRRPMPPGPQYITADIYMELELDASIDDPPRPS
jgi:putative acetyltransferase